MKKISLEDIFLACLGSQKKLKWYLENQINLVNYVEKAWPKYVFIADMIIMTVPKTKRQKIIGEISKERILKILEKERPDLYKLINTEKGLVWLDEQIVNFKSRFLK